MDREGWPMVKPSAVSRGVNYPRDGQEQRSGGLFGGLQSRPLTVIIDRSGRIGRFIPAFRSQARLRVGSAPKTSQIFDPQLSAGSRFCFEACNCTAAVAAPGLSCALLRRPIRNLRPHRSGKPPVGRYDSRKMTESLRSTQSRRLVQQTSDDGRLGAALRGHNQSGNVPSFCPEVNS
jgi:hypothetical protein